jgi:hypothetical protein
MTIEAIPFFLQAWICEIVSNKYNYHDIQLSYCYALA